MDLLYHSTASNTILGSLVTREQCVAYIPMPKGRGITPRVINVHLDLLGSLVLAVDFDAADQRVDDFRRELPDVRIIPQRLHQQP